MRPKKDAVKVSSPQCTKIESEYIMDSGGKSTKSLDVLEAWCLYDGYGPRCFFCGVCFVVCLILLTFSFNVKGKVMSLQVYICRF